MTLKKLTAIAVGVMMASSTLFAIDVPKADAKAADVKSDLKTQAATAVSDIKEKVADAIDVNQLLAWIPQIVATYGEGKSITKEQLVKVLKPQFENAIKQGAKDFPMDQITAYARFVSENLVATDLIATAAKKAGIKIDAEKIKQQIAAIKAQFGEEEFNKQLKAINITETELKNQMEQSQLINEYLMSKVNITEEEIKKFYDEHTKAFTTLNAAHILAMYPGADKRQAPTDADKAVALEKIKKAQKALSDGKAFADVAKEFSDCPSKDNGGDLGSFQPGQMVPEFEKALTTMKAGEISAPVETVYGYHIIKAGETKVAAFEEVKEMLKQDMSQEKAAEVYSNLAKQLLSENNVKFFIEPKKDEAK